MKYFLLPRLAALLVASASVLAIAADPDTDTSSIQHVTMGDKAFLLATAQDTMTQIQIGELARDKAVRSDVKDFGATMVNDHEEIKAALETLALKKEVKLPEKLDLVHGGAVDRLAKLTASQFDAAFVEDMVKQYREDAAEFQNASRATRDADVKAFIKMAFPKIEAHKVKVEAIVASKAE